MKYEGEGGFQINPPAPLHPPPTNERLSSKVPALLGSCYDSIGQLDLANWLLQDLAALVTFFQIRGRRKYQQEVAIDLFLTEIDYCYYHNLESSYQTISRHYWLTALRKFSLPGRASYMSKSLDLVSIAFNFIINLSLAVLTERTIIHKIFETNSSFHVKQRTTVKVQILFFRFLLALKNFSF